MDAFCHIVCQDFQAYFCSTGPVTVDYLIPVLTQRKLTDGMLDSHPRPFNIQPHEWTALREHVCMGGAALIKCLKLSYTVTCDYMLIKGVCNV